DLRARHDGRRAARRQRAGDAHGGVCRHAGAHPRQGGLRRALQAPPIGGEGRVRGANGVGRRDVIRHGALAAGALMWSPVPLRAAEVSAVMTALSEYMAAAKDRALPGPIVEHTVHHVLDTVAAMISGAELPPGRAALTLARAEAGRPVATVVASSTVTGAVDAALVNGVLAHSDETDDSHSASQSHPGASVVPAALAMGETAAISGRDTDHIEKGFVFGGMPARNGVTAALLVRAGWNGVDDVFSGDDDFFR